jgi:AraC-like DNA-binding protein
MSAATWSLALARPPSLAEMGIGAYVDASGRCECPRGHWRLQLFMSPARIRTGGAEVRVAEGCVAVWPPEVGVAFGFDRTFVHACSHFSLGGGPASAATQPLPELRDVGSRFAGLRSAFVEAVGWARTSPHRARARLWDLLWDVVSPAAPDEADGRHPALARALAQLERGLGGDIAVDQLASAARCSVAQLRRLFRREFGSTIVGFVRRRRVTAAVRLLRETRMSMAEIAETVGLHDARALTRAVGCELGVPPRRFRLEAAADGAP